MQLNKASKKTNKSAEKSLAAANETSAPVEKAKVRTTKSSKTKKVEGSEMTSGKNLHKPATPAIHATSQPAIASHPAPHVEAKPAAAKTVSHEEIAALAYTYWLERGCAHGFAEQDWLRAERELKSR